MTPRSAHRRSPIVVKREKRPDRLRATHADILLAPDTLEGPLPGPLLVLLSRLHRAEVGTPRHESDPAA